ncbi:MAG: hypothetical protein HY901_34605 [Deltaproteobacteria bacterium]|nr:hypothetical protein [Deltaproteobacteria bacterium]
MVWLKVVLTMIYFGRNYTSTATVPFDFEYRCCCGFRSPARVVGFASGTGHSPFFADEAGARQRAIERGHANAALDALRSARVAECPRCHRRDATEVRRFWRNWLAAAGGAVALFSLLAFWFWAFALEIVSFGFAAFGILGAVVILLQARSAWIALNRRFEFVTTPTERTSPTGTDPARFMEALPSLSRLMWHLPICVAVCLGDRARLLHELADALRSGLLQGDECRLVEESQRLMARADPAEMRTVRRATRKDIAIAVALSFAAVAFFTTAFVVTGMFAQVWMVNGLDFPVVVVTGDRHTTVEPHGREWRLLRTVPQQLEVRSTSNKLISSQRLEVPGRAGVVVFNVLGVAPLYLETLIYSLHADSGASTQMLTGRSLVVAKDIDFLFSPPPSTIEFHNDGSGRTTKRHLDMLEGGWRSSVRFSVKAHHFLDAARVAEAVALVDPTNEDAILAAARWFEEANEPELGKAFKARLSAAQAAP